MMSNNVPAAKSVAKDENQTTGGRKTTSARPPEQGLKCPRCDSANTKFCYYNNYSLTQPRHFCKTCRRYWTKGGALRNVPIGGGCRKNKKFKSSSRLPSEYSKDLASSSEFGGLNFFHGFLPAVDFELGGLSFTGLHHHQPPSTTDGGIYTQFSNFGDLSGTSGAVSTSASCFSLDPSISSKSLTGFNHPFSSPTVVNGAIHQSMRPMNAHPSLASSIESLSSINQDLHWKLQRQRLAMLFGGDSQKEINSVSTTPQFESQTQRPQPILFQNLEMSRPDRISSLGNSRSKEGPSGDSSATEWFFRNTFAPVTPVTITANSSGNDVANDNAGNWTGSVQGWGDLHQPFGTLP